MFGKSKGQKARKRPSDEGGKTKTSLSQFGLLEIPNVSELTLGGVDDDDDENDADLEAELLALTSGNSSGTKNTYQKRVKRGMDPQNLDKMFAESMDDDSNEDDVDEDDPELLAELSALGPNNEKNEESISPSYQSVASSPEVSAPAIVHPSPFLAGSSVVSLLQERIEMYKEAEDNALAAGETARAKRFTRGLKTLIQMKKNIDAGKSINEEDIPPAVLVHSLKSNSTRDLSEQNTEPPEDTPSTIPCDIAFGDKNSISTEDSQSVSEEPISEPLSSSTNTNIVLQRQTEYKLAALTAKKNGSIENALQFMKISKQLEPLVQAAREGRPIDMESLPPPPGGQIVANSTEQNMHSNKVTENSEIQTTGEPPAAPQPGPPAQANPSTAMEALEQRLAKYTEQRDKAKAEGNARKQRMNDRIIKQYQDAMRALTLGRHIDFEELPTPPGFPPIPVGQTGQKPEVSSPSDGPQQPKVPTSSVSSESSKPNTQNTQQQPSATAATKPTPQVKQNVRKDPKSMVERQLSVLKRRQDHFKVAALEAKKKGEIEQAKEYLRNKKGIEQLMLATQSGLPVDMNTVPIPPQEKLGCEDTSVDFELVDKDDCIAPPSTTPADIATTFAKLEEDLIAQIKMCAHTREHFKALGDVASANRFEQLILHTKKDLDVVRTAFKRGDKPPRFHYENRTFTMIQSNVDLNDSDCEVCIVRGINFNVSNPNDVDTYVKIEFPYPSDAPPQERTAVVKDTNNPEFNHKVVFSIDRKARALSRVFKRHAIKCQVISKGSWFHRGSVLGNVKIPLVLLETKCTLHDSFDLIDDKKKMVGGKLEVKVRVRNPILSKQMEKVTERWIVISGF